MQVVKVGGLHYFAPVEASAPSPGNVAGAAAGTSSSSSSQPPSPAPHPPSPGCGAPGGGASSAAHNLTAASRLELLEHILFSASSQGGAGLEELQKSDARLRGTLLHVFPLHDARFNRRLRKKARSYTYAPWSSTQREAFLADVRDQFGDKVAMYYHFNIFYTRWLALPSLLGSVTWLA